MYRASCKDAVMPLQEARYISKTVYVLWPTYEMVEKQARNADDTEQSHPLQDLSGREGTIRDARPLQGLGEVANRRAAGALSPIRTPMHESYHRCSVMGSISQATAEAILGLRKSA